MLETLAGHLDQLAALAPTWGFVLVFVFMAIESSFIPFPSEVVMIPAGFLAARGELAAGSPSTALVLAVLVGVAGSLVGAFANYYLALWLGRPFLERYGRYFFVKPEPLARACDVFNRYGAVTTFVCRLVPVIRQLISIPAGISRMPLLAFTVFTGLGAAVWSAVLAGVGYALGRSAGDISYLELVTRGKSMATENLPLVLGTAVGLAIAYLVVSRLVMGRSRTKAACVGFLLLSSAATAVELDSGAIRATFNARGELERLATAKGVDLLEMRLSRPEPLWTIELCRPGDFTNTTSVTAAAARRVTLQESEGLLRIAYDDIGPVRSAVVEVRTDRAEGKLRWRLSATPAEGWALYRTDFPQMRVTEAIGATGADDAVLCGLGHAGVKRNPAAPRWNRNLSMEERKSGWERRYTGGRQPGPLAAQFLTFWDATAGFYTAAEDGRGWTKEVVFRQHDGNGFLFHWRRFSYSTAADSQDYDVVFSSFDGDSNRSVDWYDAADLYKKWALTQHWCRTPLKFREDLPAWTKDAPAMVAFYVDWIERPDLIRRFYSEYWTKAFPGVPTAAALIGWEKHGEWVSLDYFPMHPSDEVTSATFRDIKAFGAHPWPWPSGHYWTLTKGKRPDGTFDLDLRADFERRGGPDMACRRPDGSVDTNFAGWLLGGCRACLCPGYAKARDFWTKNVCLELVKRGAEMIQSDQDTGAHVPECWSTAHGHLPGEGLWKTADMYEQFRSMLEACRKIEPGAIITFEEPNEHFNDLLFIQDHRNCRFAHNTLFDWEWADVFGYLYHEYVAPFQSDVVNGNSFWWTHAAVEGHVPYAARLNPSDCFDGMPMIKNAGFEEVTGSNGRLLGWDGPMNQKVVEGDRPGGRTVPSSDQAAGTDAARGPELLPRCGMSATREQAAAERLGEDGEAGEGRRTAPAGARRRQEVSDYRSDRLSRTGMRLASRER